MARFELKLPKMGESVAEATITNWLKEVGDKIEADEAVLEIATDKVDSEVPSEVTGILVEKLFGKDDLVQVGQTIAIIETEGGSVANVPVAEAAAPVETAPVAAQIPAAAAEVEKSMDAARQFTAAPVATSEDFHNSEKFFSPLVKNIAKEEGISIAELEAMQGTGNEGRVTKSDILDYVEKRKSGQINAPAATVTAAVPTETPAVIPAPQQKLTADNQQPTANNQKAATNNQQPTTKAPVSVNGQDEIIEMDRMRKLISGYMVASLQTSAHVQSFIEVDVTAIWDWREKNKNAFEKREGEKLTFTPIFMEIVAKALKDFPMMNIAVDGD